MIEHLKSTLPDIKEKRITYDMEPEHKPPQEGDYLVTICKDDLPGTVYQITGVKLVEPKKPRWFNRWALTCLTSPDLKDKVTIIRNQVQKNVVFVDIETEGGKVQAWPIVWYSRDKKKR